MASFAELWDETPADKFGGMKSAFADKIKAANDAWQAQTGKPLPITSGARTTQEQSKLYANRGANPNLVAKPGTSKHEFGEAADISPTVPDSFLQQFGLHRPHGAKDPVHVEVMAQPKLNNNFADLWESTPTETKPLEQAQKPLNLSEAMKAANKTNAPIVQGIASLGDILYGAVPGAVGAVTYAGGRALGQTPEQATATSQKVAGVISQPFGKALGLTETAGYQNETSRQIMDKIGQYIGESADVIAQKTGIPKTDVENMLGSISTVVGSKLPGAKAVVKEQFEKRFPKFEELTPVAPTVAQPIMTGVGAAKTEINPYAGKITGEEIARGQYPTVKLSKVVEDAPAVEQSIRADIANEVLGNTGQVRSGVVTGNENTLRQEYTEARSANPTAKSELLKRQIAEEQNALSRYAEKRIENSGASNNLPSDYERGQLMNDAIAGNEGLTGYLKAEKQKLYDDARAKVGDNPIQSESVANLLQNKQFRAGLGLKGNEGVAKSAEQLIELAKTVGFEDKAGNILPPNSIAAWKAVREALNGEWTKDNASTIGKINRAIDKDIALAGGQDLYKKADNLFKAEKKIFESKGIKTLFGEVDPNGVQTATNFEAIPKKLNQMPVDQWKHIYDTYDEISKGRVRGADFDLEITPELIDYANAAKAEMRGALAREIYQAGAGKAGVWNQNSVNNILNARAKKIEYAFSPEEQRAFHTLNYAGHIMPGVHAYEGAALQGQRVSKFAEKLPMVGREAGAFTRIPFGATIGEKIGEKAAQFTIGKSEQKQASKLQKEMMKNAQKGKTNLKDIGKE
jgi:D-alanyl-D-alanine carboxypeptidase